MSTSKLKFTQNTYEQKITKKATAILKDVYQNMMIDFNDKKTYKAIHSVGDYTSYIRDHVSMTIVNNVMEGKLRLDESIDVTACCSAILSGNLSNFHIDPFINEAAKGKTSDNAEKVTPVKKPEPIFVGTCTADDVPDLPDEWMPPADAIGI